MSFFKDLIEKYNRKVEQLFIQHFALNTIIVGIQASDIELIEVGVKHIEKIVPKNNSAIVKKVLGHGYKNLGAFYMKQNQLEAAQIWFQKAMSL